MTPGKCAWERACVTSQVLIAKLANTSGRLLLSMAAGIRVNLAVAESLKTYRFVLCRGGIALPGSGGVAVPEVVCICSSPRWG